MHSPRAADNTTLSSAGASSCASETDEKDRIHSVPDSLLAHAVRALSKGQAYFSPAVTKLLQEAHVRGLEERKMEDRYELLTERERQLYHLLVEGQSNKEIATRLKLSLHTIEKLGAHSIAELVLGAVRPGGVV